MAQTSGRAGIAQGHHQNARYEARNGRPFSARGQESALSRLQCTVQSGRGEEDRCGAPVKIACPARVMACTGVALDRMPAWDTAVGAWPFWMAVDVVDGVANAFARA